jgi:hypothetical protein
MESGWVPFGDLKMFAMRPHRRWNSDVLKGVLAYHAGRFWNFVTRAENQPLTVAHLLESRYRYHGRHVTVVGVPDYGHERCVLRVERLPNPEYREIWMELDDEAKRQNPSLYDPPMGCRVIVTGYFHFAGPAGSGGFRGYGHLNGWRGELLVTKVLDCQRHRSISAEQTDEQRALKRAGPRP